MNPDFLYFPFSTSSWNHIAPFHDSCHTDDPLSLSYVLRSYRHILPQGLARRTYRVVASRK
jgi:hypothetical protein